MGESFVFCPARLDSRLLVACSRFLILDSRFAQELRITNAVENRDSQRTVNLLLNARCCRVHCIELGTTN